MVALMVAVHAWSPPHARTLESYRTHIHGDARRRHLQRALRHPDIEPSRWRSRVSHGCPYSSLSDGLPSRTLSTSSAGTSSFRCQCSSRHRCSGAAGLPTSVKVMMIASGAFAFAGLLGVAMGDMQVRNIGIIGYVPLFLILRDSVSSPVLSIRTAGTHSSSPNVRDPIDLQNA